MQLPMTLREGLVRGDRLLVLFVLVVVTATAWAYLIHQSRTLSTQTLHGVYQPQVASWGSTDLLLLFVMWAVMMVAMMAPSAAPLLLVYSRAHRRPGTAVTGPATLLLLGYLLAWIGFSLVTTIGQWGLHSAALLSPMMVGTSPLLGGILLISAGLYQTTPLKQACLRHCRSPMGFLMSEWQHGRKDPLWMGVRHGTYCIGCCWLIMALLFVAGVMNLVWVAAIAAFVLVERTVPKGQTVGTVAGALLILSGVVMILV